MHFAESTTHARRTLSAYRAPVSAQPPGSGAIKRVCAVVPRDVAVQFAALVPRHVGKMRCAHGLKAKTLNPVPSSA